MTGGDYCGRLRNELANLKLALVNAQLWEDSYPTPANTLMNIKAAIKNLEEELGRTCGGIGTTSPQQGVRDPAAEDRAKFAAIKSSSPGQATPVPPTSYVGQGSQKQQPAFGMAVAQKKPPAFGGAGFNRY